MYSNILSLVCKVPKVYNTDEWTHHQSTILYDFAIGPVNNYYEYYMLKQLLNATTPLHKINTTTC